MPIVLHCIFKNFATGMEVIYYFSHKVLRHKADIERAEFRKRATINRSSCVLPEIVKPQYRVIVNYWTSLSSGE